MGYSLVEFCDDVREILRESDDRDGRERVRQKLEALLGDRNFRAQYVGPGNDAGMERIYEDPELRFCVLTYNMTEPRTSPPHDHGASWAVYGQASGHTDMTVWSAPDDGGRLDPLRTFRLAAGQAGLFDVREIHSIEYTTGAKFVRVTGVDMTDQERRVFDPETGEVREVQGVSASGSRWRANARVARPLAGKAVQDTGSGDRPDPERPIAQLGEVPAFPERRPIHREISEDERSYLEFIDIYAGLTDNELRRCRRPHPEEGGIVTGFCQRARDEGRAEGIERGIERGRTEGGRAVLARQLQRRFGRLPPEAAERLQRAPETELEAWADNVLDAETLDDVFRSSR